MNEVDASNLGDYLSSLDDGQLMRLGIGRGELPLLRVSELAWGVSNIVLRVDCDRTSFVVKQSRRQLRTKIDWFSRLERIWREIDVLHVLHRILPAGRVPRVLFEDRHNYLFAMEAIDADHRVWKADLLAGHIDEAVATQVAGLLATIHRETTGSAELAATLDDRTCFDELRLDPFYRYVAEHHEVVRKPLLDLIDATLSRRDCLVLADFSPKNILLTSSGPVLVDFETGHFGDPGFDVGFFLSHLLLKTLYHADRLPIALRLATDFWSHYSSKLATPPAPAWLDGGFITPDNGQPAVGNRPGYESCCIQHLAACMLARIDGKSRIDYLPKTGQQQLVREFCHKLLIDRPDSLAAVFESLSRRIADSRQTHAK